MTQYVIEMSLNCSPCSQPFELPDQKKWSDVKDWYIKWDTLHVTFDGENWLTLELDSDPHDTTDWKRPTYASVHTFEPKEGSQADYIDEMES